jgi:mono/diheme cytochrome c family protein
MKFGFVIGLIVGVLLIPVGAYLYFAGGYAPVATSAPPMPFEKMLAHKALDARLAKEMPKAVPMEPTEANFLAGAVLYKEQCAVCHGLPGSSKTAIAAGMFPRPPQLLQGKGVTDDEPAETYWKVANGIRLTGMPAFRGALKDLARKGSGQFVFCSTSVFTALRTRWRALTQVLLPDISAVCI